MTLATVIDYDSTDEEVRADLGGDDTVTATHVGPSGDDSPPLAGDEVELVDTDGAGAMTVAGYADGTTKTAAKGEKRIYSRTPDGELAAEFHLKGDGSVIMRNLLVPASETIEISALGIVSISGIPFLTHVHPTAAAGPPSPPQAP